MKITLIIVLTIVVVLYIKYSIIMQQGRKNATKKQSFRFVYHNEYECGGYYTENVEETNRIANRLKKHTIIHQINGTVSDKMNYKQFKKFYRCL